MIASERNAYSPNSVIPAQAGIHLLEPLYYNLYLNNIELSFWIPVFTGMTEEGA
jgi:hypothetical protein